MIGLFWYGFLGVFTVQFFLVLFCNSFSVTKILTELQFPPLVFLEVLHPHCQ